jgi:hypothetical protein
MIRTVWLGQGCCPNAASGSADTAASASSDAEVRAFMV